MELPLVEWSLLKKAILGKHCSPETRAEDIIVTAIEETLIELQRDADLLILNQVEQKHQEECLSCLSAKLYDEPYARIVELEQRIREREQECTRKGEATRLWRERSAGQDKLIAELKQFDIRQYIPEGKICNDEPVCAFCVNNEEEDMENYCSICKAELEEDMGEIQKCASCPKPYKEQV